MDLHTNIVPVFYIRRLMEISREQGISAQRLLEGTGLNADEIDSPGSFITHAQQIQIFMNGLTLAPEPDLGIRMGEGYRAQDMGIYGLVVQTSKNIHQAMVNANRFVEIAGGFTDTKLSISSSEYRISVTENYPMAGTHKMVVDELIFGYHAVFNHFVDQAFTPTSITFDYPKPEHVDRYREFFGCPVQFSARHSSLIYPKAYGDIPIKYHDADANEVCVQRAEQLLKRLREADSMEGRVKKILLQLGSNRRNAEEVAERLHISPRHLRRILSEEGTSFQKVFDEVRFQLARNYLEQTVLTIEQMAPLIGFTETNNFRRAFKKWSGLSPTEYRSQLDRQSAK